jgi:hypothetical protein
MPYPSPSKRKIWVSGGIGVRINEARKSAKSVTLTRYTSASVIAFSVPVIVVIGPVPIGTWQVVGTSPASPPPCVFSSQVCAPTADAARSMNSSAIALIVSPHRNRSGICTRERTAITVQV